jgi:hypothetical protein
VNQAEDSASPVDFGILYSGLCTAIVLYLMASALAAWFAGLPRVLERLCCDVLPDLPWGEQVDVSSHRRLSALETRPRSALAASASM